MRSGRAEKNVLQRHPFLFGTAAIVIAAIAFMPKGSDYKPVDYSKPVYTEDSAIICPQSLLFDLRADHDANAIFEAFTSFSHRDEKARALGCEVVRGGIPVTAHRMSSPFSEYVAVSLGGISTGDFFTMEGGNLENGPADEGSPQVSTIKTAGTTEASITSSYETSRSDFRNQLSKLGKPMPNLRWFPQTAVQGAYPNQIDSLLVTPYGPCANLIGNDQGYGVVSMHINPYLPPVASKIVGNYPDQATATAAAESYCKEWYANERAAPQRPGQTEHMWFAPEEERSSDTPAEIIRQPPTSDPTPTEGGASAAIEPATKPSAAEAQFKWQLKPNGDEVLIGPSGPCATLALLSAHDPNKLHVNFSDGSVQIYPVEQTAEAMESATNYCRAHL
jgi:hypothetical protein